MKAIIKLLVGTAFAAVAIMAVSISPNLGTQVSSHDGKNECFSQVEVELLMKSNHWSKEDTEMLLRLACQFSKRPK